MLKTHGLIAWLLLVIASPEMGYKALAEIPTQQLTASEKELNSALAALKLESSYAAAQKISEAIKCTADFQKLSFQLSSGMISSKQLVRKLSHLSMQDKSENKLSFAEYLHTFSICWVKFETKRRVPETTILKKSQTLFTDQVKLGLTDKNQSKSPAESPIKLKPSQLLLAGTVVAAVALVGASAYKHPYFIDETYNLVLENLDGDFKKLRPRFTSYQKRLRQHRKAIKYENVVAKNVGMCCPGAKKFVNESPWVLKQLYKAQSFMDGGDAPYSTLAVILASSALWTLSLDSVENEEQKASSAKFMGLTMGALGLVKLLNVGKTASSLSKYDLLIQSSSSSGSRRLARAGFGYSLLYPYIEALIGISYLSGKNQTASHVAAIVTQGATALGALMIVIDGTEIICACNGASSKMKVGWVTVTESFAMVAMAAHGLWIAETNKAAPSPKWKLEFKVN